MKAYLVTRTMTFWSCQKQYTLHNWKSELLVPGSLHVNSADGRNPAPVGMVNTCENPLCFKRSKKKQKRKNKKHMYMYVYIYIHSASFCVHQAYHPHVFSRLEVPMINGVYTCLRLKSRRAHDLLSVSARKKDFIKQQTHIFELTWNWHLDLW